MCLPAAFHSTIAKKVTASAMGEESAGEIQIHNSPGDWIPDKFQSILNPKECMWKANSRSTTSYPITSQVSYFVPSLETYFRKKSTFFLFVCF